MCEPHSIIHLILNDEEVQLNNTKNVRSEPQIYEQRKKQTFHGKTDTHAENTHTHKNWLESILQCTSAFNRTEIVIHVVVSCFLKDVFVLAVHDIVSRQPKLQWNEQNERELERERANNEQTNKWNDKYIAIRQFLTRRYIFYPFCTLTLFTR